MDKRASIELVALKCPTCSGDIGTGPDDRAFLCRRCLSLWGREEAVLVEKRMEWVGSDDPDCRYFPFWVFRMTAETPVGRIDDFFSYCGSIAFPENTTVGANRPISLFVLAVSLRVERHRLAASRAFTYAQPLLAKGKPSGGLVWGPCMDEHTAAAYARVIFISTLSEEKKGSRDFVAGLTIALDTPLLVYVPFRERGSDYRDGANIAAIPKELLGSQPVSLRD